MVAEASGASRWTTAVRPAPKSATDPPLRRDHRAKTTRLNAKEIAEKAVQMYPDKKVKFEIDFLEVYGHKNWVFGHVGISDLDHVFWSLDHVMSMTENNVDAFVPLYNAVEEIESQRT